MRGCQIWLCPMVHTWLAMANGSWLEADSEAVELDSSDHDNIIHVHVARLDMIDVDHWLMAWELVYRVYQQRHVHTCHISACTCTCTCTCTCAYMSLSLSPFPPTHRGSMKRGDLCIEASNNWHSIHTNSHISLHSLVHTITSTQARRSSQLAKDRCTYIHMWILRVEICYYNNNNY